MYGVIGDYPSGKEVPRMKFVWENTVISLIALLLLVFLGVGMGVLIIKAIRRFTKK